MGFFEASLGSFVISWTLYIVKRKLIKGRPSLGAGGPQAHAQAFFETKTVAFSRLLPSGDGFLNAEKRRLPKRPSPSLRSSRQEMASLILKEKAS